MLQKAGEVRNTNIEAEGLERIQLAVIASCDDKGINTTSLAKNLREINNLTDLYNQAISENTQITLPKTIKLNDIGYTIKLDGKVEKTLLPVEYQQVEYIESTGTQYIDTKLLASNYMDLIVEIEGNYTKTNYQYIFGAGFHYDYKTNCSWILMGCIKDSIFGAQNGISGKEKEIDVANTQKHTFIVDTVSNVGKVDQVSQILDARGVKKINYNYVLFALNNHGIVNNNASFKMNYCNISNNNTLIRNYIPCKSTITVTNVDGKQCSTGTIGLYDLVEGKFYTNQGNSDDFIAGPDV